MARYFVRKLYSDTDYQDFGPYSEREHAEKYEQDLLANPKREYVTEIITEV